MGMTIRQALAQAGLAPIDAQVLLAHTLKRDRGWLIAHATDPLAIHDVETFFALARRRRDGEPVAYLTGGREFYGLSLAVNRSVLIPRPETETLIDCALAKLPSDRTVDVVDLGTGSGAIALALAYARPLARVTATDRSSAALAVARANAERLRLSNVRCVEADWYQGLPDDARFDLIASNPPYVAENDPHLFEGDLRFEPAAALASGVDGLHDLRLIIRGAPGRLISGGWLVVEHAFNQAEQVCVLLAQAGFAALESLRDLSGIQRVAAGRRP